MGKIEEWEDEGVLNKSQARWMRKGLAGLGRFAVRVESRDKELEARKMEVEPKGTEEMKKGGGVKERIGLGRGRYAGAVRTESVEQVNAPIEVNVAPVVEYNADEMAEIVPEAECEETMGKGMGQTCVSWCTM